MHMRALLLATLVSGIVACAPGADPDFADRGPLGKADNFGSCAADDEDHCGEKSDGSCWCDELCVEYGDCCDDKATVCGGETPAQRTVEVILTEPYCDECTSADKNVILAASPIVSRVVALIDGAQNSVAVAQFTFSRREIEDALVRADQRGVEVRVAMDAAQDRDGSLARRLRDAGVDVRFVAGVDNGSYAGIQHAKFMLVDGDTLLTGSNNWSSTGVSINSENTIVVTGSADEPQIAAFTCHFAAIWASNTDGAGACSTDGIAFSPSSAGKSLIRDAIRASTSSVDVLMHHFTFTDLVKELAVAQERGVDVRVIVNEADRAEHSGSNWTRLFSAGGQIRYKRSNEAAYQLMHHKLAIIDDAILVNGSGNWSGSGFFNNYENYVRYDEATVVAAFVSEFHTLWTWSLSGASLDSGASAAEQHASTTNAYFGNLHAHFYARDGARLLDDGKGMIHDETDQPIPGVLGSTVAESAELAFEYARDMGGMDFLALTPHCADDSPSDGPDIANMSEAGFQEMRGAADKVTTGSAGDFIALAGFEWSTNSTGNHVNVLGASAIAKSERGAFDQLYDDYLPARAAAGDKPVLMLNHPRTMRMNLESLDGSWDQVYDVSLADIPKSSERNKKFNDFGIDDYAPLNQVRDQWIAGDALPDRAVVSATMMNIATLTAPYARLMEVTLNRGSEFASESPQNPSMTALDEGGFERRTKAHSDWDYFLLHGFRVAPVASHDNHYSNWGTGHTTRTGIIATALSQSSLFAALDRRLVFASEDQNTELRLYAADRIPMGGETATLGSTIDADLFVFDPDYSGAYEVRLYVGQIGGNDVRLQQTYQLAADGWLAMSVPLAAGTTFFYVEVVELDVDRMSWSAPIWVERL